MAWSLVVGVHLVSINCFISVLALYLPILSESFRITPLAPGQSQLFYRCKWRNPKAYFKNYRMNPLWSQRINLTQQNTTMCIFHGTCCMPSFLIRIGYPMRNLWMALLKLSEFKFAYSWGLFHLGDWLDTICQVAIFKQCFTYFIQNI